MGFHFSQSGHLKYGPFNRTAFSAPPKPFELGKLPYSYGRGWSPKVWVMDGLCLVPYSEYNLFLHGEGGLVIGSKLLSIVNRESSDFLWPLDTNYTYLVGWNIAKRMLKEGKGCNLRVTSLSSIDSNWFHLNGRQERFRGSPIRNRTLSIKQFWVTTPKRSFSLFKSLC